MSVADSQEDSTGTASPARPSSAWTNDSVFADSAISMRMRSPAPHEKEASQPDLEEAPEQPVIADRLNGLVSEIWACEQEGPLHREKRRRIEEAMHQIEAVLQDDVPMSEGSDTETTHTTQASQIPEPAAPMVTESDLEIVRNSLANTVESMRMRQQEQRHLHELTVEKLEAVAQRCIQQERQLREYAVEMAALEETNRTLSHEIENLSIQLLELHSQSAKKEVAVKAMSSAVSGLEGWINGSPVPNHAPHRQKIVTRGRGRFRGRYYVEEPEDTPIEYGLDGASDAKGLREGVSAWLRGFRDVEEELNSTQIDSGNARKEGLHRISRKIEDEWGDLETVTES